MNSESPEANLRTPEKVMCTPQAPRDHIHLSPKLTASRVPKIKMDLDSLECEAEEIDEIEPVEILNELNLENVESDEPSSGDTSLRLESVYFEDYLFDKTLSVTNEIKIELGSDGKCYKGADTLQRFDTPTFDIINRTYFTEADPNWYEENFPPLDQLQVLKTVSKPDNRVQEGYSSRSSSPPAKRSRKALQFENETTSVSDLDAKVSESEECTWISGSMTMNIRGSAKYPDSSMLANELAQLVMTICCNNGIPVAMLGEKLTHLSQELVQVRANLTTEMPEIENILGQFKSLRNASDNIQPTKPSLPPPPPYLQELRTVLEARENRKVRTGVPLLCNGVDRRSLSKICFK